MKFLRPVLPSLAALAVAVGLLVVNASGASAATVVVGVSGPNSAEVGGSFSLSISYSCSGNDDCQNVKINVTPSGSLSGGGSCDLGTVETGSSSQCSVNVSFASSIPNGATGTATATATLSNGSGNSAQKTITAINNGATTTTSTTTTSTTTSTTTTTTQPPAPEVWIDKYRSDASLFPGQTFTYHFRIRNIGTYPLDTVEMTDHLPDVFLYSNPQASDGGEVILSGNTLVFRWDTLAVGQEVTASIEALVAYPAPIPED